MNVVRPILLVIEVDQQGRVLDPEGVQLGRVSRAEPGEVEILPATRELIEQVGPDRFGEVVVIRTTNWLKVSRWSALSFAPESPTGAVDSAWAEFGVVVTSGTSESSSAGISMNRICGSRPRAVKTARARSSSGAHPGMSYPSRNRNGSNRPSRRP
jgi:hypothetical protein